MPTQNIHVIVMPNKICNLACTYCYVLNKPEERMSIALAKHLVDKLLGYNDPTRPTRFIWHGGEPMLAGINFYRQLCSYIRNQYPSYIVQHYIQTNGTLLTHKWVDFFLIENCNKSRTIRVWQGDDMN